MRVFDLETSLNRALLEIDEIFNVHSLSCQRLGLPVPTISQIIEEPNAIIQ